MPDRPEPETVRAGPAAVSALIDTHCHLIERGRFLYPWLETVPALDRDAPLAAYRDEAAAAGVTQTVFMEVDVHPADSEAEAAWAATLFAAVIAAARPEHPDFPAQLERLAGNKAVRGLRRVLHTEPEGLCVAAPFPEHLRLLASRGLTFDLCVRPTQLEEAAALVRACPETQFVLDHCGNPPLGEELGSWRRGLAALADCPNLACKLSGLVNHAGPGWTDATLRPALDAALELFGPGRLVWGSDWPVCTLAGSLADWTGATRRALDALAQEERHAILAGTATRLYRL